MSGDGAVADGKSLDAGPDLRDVTHHLVAEHQGPRDRTGKLGDVRATEPAAPQAEQELSRTDRGTRPLLDLEPLAAEDRGPHTARPGQAATVPSRAAVQQRSAIAILRRAGTVTRSPNTR